MICRIKDEEIFRVEVIAEVLNKGKILFNIGNADNFLETIEQLQILSGKSSNNLIPIEFKYEIDTTRKVHDTLNYTYTAISIIMIIYIIRSMRGAQGSMKGKKGDIFSIG